MENIEQTIVELGGIFSQLAHMVKEQEEEIKRFVTSFSYSTGSIKNAAQLQDVLRKFIAPIGLVK